MARTAHPKRLLHIGMDGLNLPLLRKFAAQGVLPTFSRLMARGATNRLLPAIPAWTPTNWATMATGAPAGTHGLGGWSVRQKTDPWEAPRLDSWQADAMTAESLWEVADQAGLRTVVTFYPSGSWPSRLRHGYVIAPGLHDSPFELARPAQYVCSVRPGPAASGTALSEGPALRDRTTDVAETGLPPGTARVGLAPARAQGWREVSEGALAGVLPVALRSGARQDLYVLVEAGPTGEPGSMQRVLVCASPDPATQLAVAELDRWSEFAVCRWGGSAGGAQGAEGSVRFRLLEARPDQRMVRLCRSQVYATRGFAMPDGLDRRLLEACGPLLDFVGVGASGGDAELAACLDDLRYQGEWNARAARYLATADHGGWDVHWSHWHPFDHMNHPTVNPGDPDGPEYDPIVGAWMMEAQRQTYIMADDVLRQFLELADEDTVVCVAADHGMSPTHRSGNVATRLAECGLLALQPDGRTIDLSRSRVYLQPDRGAEVYVSLRGREPFGIVAPEDFERVQEAVIDALVDWQDPGNANRRLVALALKLQDAQLIGFWGNVCGDVVFVMNRGYGLGPPVEGGVVGRGRGAMHSSQIPTSETPHFTNMGCWILAGAGIKPGYERDWQRYGLMRMVDVAPTLCHLLGLRPPEHSVGAVCHDLFEN